MSTADTSLPLSSNSSRIGWSGLALPYGWTVEQLSVAGMVFTIVFLNGADFRGATDEEFTVHWQIYLRLLGTACAGMVGALYLFPKTYRDFLAWPGMLLVVYCGIYLLTIPFSIARSYSAAAWVSLVCVVLFVPAAMRVLGGFRLLLVVTFSIVVYMVGSWVAYLFFPDIGVFKEQVTRTEVFNRMGGLGHPNELGFISAFGLILSVTLGLSKRVSWFFAGGIALLAIITLLTCFSRTAIIVAGFGLLFTMQNQLRLRGNLFGVIAVAALISIVVFAAVGTGKLDWVIEDALQRVTKSGSSDELTTATGRTEIWQYAISQIVQSPLTGYGYCTARFIMEDHSFHCHNIILNALLFGGAVAGLVVFSMVLYHAFSILGHPRWEIDGLAAAMLAAGMVDALISAASPAAASFIWIMILFWRQMNMQVAPSSQARLFSGN